VLNHESLNATASIRVTYDINSLMRYV
jgi:hypothetical protein